MHLTLNGSSSVTFRSGTLNARRCLSYACVRGVVSALLLIPAVLVTDVAGIKTAHLRTALTFVSFLSAGVALVSLCELLAFRWRAFRLLAVPVLAALIPFLAYMQTTWLTVRRPPGLASALESVINWIVHSADHPRALAGHCVIAIPLVASFFSRSLGPRRSLQWCVPLLATMVGWLVWRVVGVDDGPALLICCSGRGQAPNYFAVVVAFVLGVALPLGALAGDTMTTKWRDTLSDSSTGEEGTDCS